MYFQGPQWYLWKHSLDMEAVRAKESLGTEKREADFEHYFLFQISEPSLLFKSYWIFQKIISKHITRAVGQGLYSYFKKKYLKYFRCCSVFTCTNLDLELERWSDYGFALCERVENLVQKEEFAQKSSKSYGKPVIMALFDVSLL